MSTTFTVSDYAQMPSREKKKFVKEVLRGANEDQQALLKRYEEMKSSKGKKD